MSEKRLESVACTDEYLPVSILFPLSPRIDSLKNLRAFASIPSRLHSTCHSLSPRDLHVLLARSVLLIARSPSLFARRIYRFPASARSLAPHTAFEASLAGIVLATRIPTRGKSYRDTRCASEICDRVNDAGAAAI